MEFENTKDGVLYDGVSTVEWATNLMSGLFEDPETEKDKEYQDSYTEEEKAELKEAYGEFANACKDFLKAYNALLGDKE